MVETEELKKAGFSEEEVEVAVDSIGNVVYGKTGWPKSDHRYRVVYQVFNMSIEELYFWVLEFMRTENGYSDIIKLSDLFTASEHSAFFGSAQQRLGLQQDKVSQFLATIGKMVKELFQLVRELRILDERLNYYEDSMTNSRSNESAEITLKGIWIDMVEQGAKNPASVYGMARELEFTTLPDLFFAIHPKRAQDVDEVVDKLEFNRKIKEVLKRKLRTYLEWKETTWKEVKNRKLFTLKYLRQHFDIIKMYMNWVKPYLRNIRRLQLTDATKSPDLIAAFENALVEIEILCKKLPQERVWAKEVKQNKWVYSVVSVHVFYRSKPQMAYQQEYQRGPLHVGMIDVTFRAYAWTEQQIKKYIELKDREDMELLKAVDGSVKAAMEALGDELEGYLKEAGEKINLFVEKQPKKKGSPMYEPFTSIFKGFGELFGRTAPGGISKSEAERMHPNKHVLDKEKKLAATSAAQHIWYVYKYFKKKEGLLAW